MTKILGSITTYAGIEHAYLRDHKVRIVGVLKRAAQFNYIPERDAAYLTDESEVALAGGVTIDDRIEVQPWLEEEQRWSVVSSAARAVDLACFSHLRNPRIKRSIT
jgi:hypothetical protein